MRYEWRNQIKSNQIKSVLASRLQYRLSYVRLFGCLNDFCGDDLNSSSPLVGEFLFDLSRVFFMRV